MRRPCVILPIVAAALLIAGCDRQAPAARQDQPLPSVTSAAVAKREIAGAMTASGRLVAREEVAVAADLNGFRVARVLVEEGQHVRAGEVLAVLDDSLLRPQIDQLRAALTQQQIAAEQAQKQADRVKGLDDRGVLTREAVDTRRFAARSTTAAVAATHAQLDDLLTRQRHLLIRAPVDGVVLERSVRPGDTSSTGSTMFRLARGGLIELYAEIPENDVKTIAIGDPAEVVLASGRTLTGKVRLLGMRVDAQTGLTVARIALPIDPELRLGGFAEARFTRNFQALAVPEAAVHFDADGASVKRIDPTMHVHEAKVRTGRRGQGLVEIVAGLGEGDRVAVKGSAFVLDGDKVRIVGASGR